MEKIFMSLIFAVALLIYSPLASAEDVHLLSVTGSGTVNSAPDVASISVGVSTFSKDASTAQIQNASSSQAIINALVNLGIERKNIQTSNYNFSPTYRTEENRQHEINGYRVSNLVNVTVYDLNLVGKIIDAALSNGANEINSLDFSVKDQSQLKTQALKLATKAAREKAELIANELGCKIVGIYRVNESVNRIYARQSNKLMAMGMVEMATADTAIEGGTLSLDANVSIDFIIE